MQANEPPAPSPGTAHSVVGIEVHADATVGYASLQNNIPLVRELRITNNSHTALSNVEVVLEADPPFAEGARLRFDLLAVGETRRITPIDLRIHHHFLSQLDEMVRAKIKISVREDEKTISTVEHAVDVLAYDQWAGSRALPELLAAFCMPNSPAVDSLVRKASALLRATAAASAMDGYQSRNREQVRQQVLAIYNAIALENLHYANPPASFTAEGQKIRTPDRILSSKLGTCLDLTMLMASALEQAGLNSAILFKLVVGLLPLRFRLRQLTMFKLSASAFSPGSSWLSKQRCLLTNKNRACARQ
jgi:hypothetical protein